MNGWISARIVLWPATVILSLGLALALPRWLEATWRHQRQVDVPLRQGDYQSLHTHQPMPELRDTVVTLSSAATRLPGTDGHKQAADWIHSQLEQIAPGRVRSETFAVTVPSGEPAMLSIRSAEGIVETLAVAPLWPNLVVTNQTPPEGLSGPLVDGGNLAPGTLDGRPIAGAVVLAEFNTGDRFLHLFDRGALAVLFLEPETTVRGEAEDKLLSVPVSAPRFLLSAEQGRRLQAQLARGEALHATIRCTQRWQEVETANWIAEIPGTDPLYAREVLVLAAYYDAMSIVPGRAPGASQACGMAALLALGRELAAAPPERPVWLAALSGHGQGLAGARDLVQRYTQGGIFGINALDLRGPAGSGPPEIVFFVGLDLSAGSGTVMALRQGFWYAYDEDETQVPYRRMALRLSKTVEDMAAQLGVEPRLVPFINGLRPFPGTDWRAELGCMPGFDAEAPIGRGTYGLTLATARDLRVWVDTPLDTPERLDWANLERQVAVLRVVIRDLFNDPASYHAPARPEVAWKWKDWTCRVHVRLVESDLEAGFLPSRPVPGGLAVLRGQDKSLAGVRGDLIQRTDEQGHTSMVGVGWPAMQDEAPVREFLGFLLHPDNGTVVMAIDKGIGAQDFPNAVDLDAPEEQVTLLLFRCHATDLHHLVDPRLFAPLLSVNLIDARTESSPLSYGLFTSAVIKHEYNPWAVNYLTRAQPVATLFNTTGCRFKVTSGHGTSGPRLLLSNAVPQQPAGMGFAAESTPRIEHVALSTARDLVALNRARLDLYQRHGIVDQRTLQFHQRAESALRAAQAAQQQLHQRVADQQAEAAWSLGIRAYKETLAVAVDVLRGVLFYLCLLIPFSVFAERIFFGFSGIYARLATSCGLFLAVFLGLAFVHPAFQLTSMPFVVLLAFVTLVLTVLVSVIIFRKFGDYLAHLSERVGRGTADTGRTDLLGTVFMVGVSNMNRHGTRTALTLFSVTVLSFAAISFTSVSTETRARGISLGSGANYTGLLLRGAEWGPLASSAAASFETEFAEAGRVASRYWLLPGTDNRAFFWVTGPRQGSRFRCDGILGLLPEEMRVSAPAWSDLRGRMFHSPDESSVIISQAAADALGVAAPGEHLRMLGLDLEVVGILPVASADEVHAATRLAGWRDLDGESLLPVRFADIAALHNARGERDRLFAQYQHLNADTTFVLPAGLVRGLGGRLQSVAVAFDRAEDVRQQLEDLFQRKELFLYVGLDGERFLYSSVGLTQYHGPSGLLVPMAIMFLIVLNTMLGSVYERKREIAIHSAVGLSPLHIAGLFIAEACVFSVIGSVAGYFIGQSVAALVRHTGALPGLVPNYSSLSAVGSAAMVMGTVLLSTLYPAYQAARIATPGERAHWRFPDPEGDVLRVELPFTASSHALGLARFLAEFLREHSEGHGDDFAGEDVRLTSDEGRITVHAMTWLAPFDLGVSQRFTFELLPFEEGPVRIANLTLERQSGEHDTWCRLNRRFLQTLRNQFLLWRSFADGLRDRYERMDDDRMTT